MNAKKIMSLFALVLLLVAALFLVGCKPTYTEEEVAGIVAKVTEQKEAENKAVLDLIKASSANDIADAKAQADKANADVAELQKKVESIEQAKAAEEAAKIEADKIDAAKKAIPVYVEDDLELGGSYDFTISDRDLSSLMDTIIEFDGEDYDVEEVLEIEDATISINGDDYKSDSYLTLQEGDIVYKVVFEDALDTDDISDDEPLSFELLGKNVEIVEWDGNDVTFYNGNKYFLVEGESIMVGSDNITLNLVNDDYTQVKIISGDCIDAAKIIEGNTKKLCGIEVRVKEVLDNEEGLDYATIEIGESVKNEISSGDEYEDDSQFDWVIGTNFIGVVLNENLDQVDEDGDARHPAIAVDGKICLPNDYVCIRYDGIADEKVEEYSFELDNGMIEARGKFLNGIEDYDVVYINATGIYNDDDELLDVSTIKLDDTDVSLVTNGTIVTIGDIEFDLGLTYIEVAGDDISGNEEDYRTVYGIVIETPEDIEDNEVNIVVPQEALEASISFIGVV
jgi:hypothetical protein